MKNKLIIIFYFFLQYLFAENLLIESKNISIDKNKEIQFLKMKYCKTEDKIIKSDYAEYNKKQDY